MGNGTGFKVEGMAEFLAALRRFPQATRRGAARGMKRGMLRVQRAARENAPVDRGGLRQSIAEVVRGIGVLVRGIVGSAKHYAPYMEFGTKPYWPPIKALEVWARRHGTSAFLVARAIATHGIKARRFLRRAFEGEIDNVMQDLRDEIGREIEGLGR